IRVTVRGRGSGGGARVMLPSATRRASVTVSVRRIDGLFADNSSNSARPSRNTKLSRSAVTVAVRAPPARKAISPTGCPAPSSAHAPAPTSHSGQKTPRDDDVERIARLPLAHERIPALEIQRLELGGKTRSLALFQIAEDLNAVEAVLGNLGFHRWSCSQPS